MRAAPKLTLGRILTTETPTESKRFELRNMLISNILNTLSKDPELPPAIFKQMADGVRVAGLISQFVEPLLDCLYPLGKP